MDCLVSNTAPPSTVGSTPDQNGSSAMATDTTPVSRAETSGARGGGRRHPLIWFALRRLLAGIVTLLVASVLIFLATNALPGNVADVVLGKAATPESVARLTHELGLDRPLAARYGSWLWGLLHGDLGHSAVALAQQDPQSSVSTLIATPLVNSLVLAALTILILIPLALLLGTLAAVRAGRPGDYVVSYVALAIGALPEFVFGTLLIVVFFSWLGLFPPVALIPPGTSPLSEIKELVLPVLTMVGVLFAFCMRQVRAGVVAALEQDFVTMARLGGIREHRVLSRYALRNSLAPSIQTFAQSIQYLFGGIVVVETLFAYPGIGKLLVQAVMVRDVTEVQGITIVLAAVYVAINIVADLLVVVAVPKLRTGIK
jgi:peptide/nickel transport system permease protein